jgi:multiple sugar transport system permease protein
MHKSTLENRLKHTIYTIWSQRISWFLMIPFLVFFVFAVFIPAAVSIILGFCNFNMFQSITFAGLDNYINLFLNDNVFIKSLSNTIVFAVVVGPMSYIISFLVAWIINDIPAKLRSVVTLIFYAPSISGSAVIIFKLLLSPDSNGYLNAWLLNIGIIDKPNLWFSDPSLALGLVIMVQLWLSLGVGFLAFIAGLKNVDRSLYECASIDGIRNRWQELWYITFPCMKPMLLFGAVTQITGAFSGGGIASELCGNPSIDYSAHTLSLHANDYAGVRLEMGYAAAISIVIFVIIILMYKVSTLLLNRVGK